MMHQMEQQDMDLLCVLILLEQMHQNGGIKSLIHLMIIHQQYQ